MNSKIRFSKGLRDAVFVLSIALVACAAVLPAAGEAFAQPAKAASACDEARRTSIKATVTTEHARLQDATFWWSAAVGVTQYGSIALSLLAGLFMKTGWLKDRTKNTTTALTSLSALFIAASAAGGFHEKWQANRTAAAAAKALIYELDKSSVDCDAVLSSLQELTRAANDSIVTAGTGTRPIATE